MSFSTILRVLFVVPLGVQQQSSSPGKIRGVDSLVADDPTVQQTASGYMLPVALMSDLDSIEYNVIENILVD